MVQLAYDSCCIPTLSVHLCKFLSVQKVNFFVASFSIKLCVGQTYDAHFTS